MFVFVACGPDTISVPNHTTGWVVTQEYYADSFDIGQVIILRAENVETGVCYLLFRQGNSMDTLPYRLPHANKVFLCLRRSFEL